MVVINKSKSVRYSALADRSLQPGCGSADRDMAGLVAAMDAVVRGCGSSFTIRFNPRERDLFERIAALDREGSGIRVEARKPVNPLHELLMKEEAEKRRKIASIEADRKREESIMSETTYTSRKDMDAARAKAGDIKGEVKAKKLDKKADEPVSLKDLMGDNKFIEEARDASVFKSGKGDTFIEESMKHSGIKTTLASEEGWDVSKMNEGMDTGADAPAAEPAEPAEPAQEPEAEPAKGTTSKKKRSTTKSEGKKASRRSQRDS